MIETGQRKISSYCPEWTLMEVVLQKHVRWYMKKQFLYLKPTVKEEQTDIVYSS